MYSGSGGVVQCRYCTVLSTALRPRCSTTSTNEFHLVPSGQLLANSFVSRILQSFFFLKTCLFTGCFYLSNWTITKYYTTLYEVSYVTIKRSYLRLGLYLFSRTHTIHRHTYCTSAATAAVGTCWALLIVVVAADQHHHDDLKDVHPVSKNAHNLCQVGGAGVVHLADDKLKHNIVRTLQYSIIYDHYFTTIDTILELIPQVDSLYYYYYYYYYRLVLQVLILLF